MKAAQIKEYGGEDVVQIVEQADKPMPLMGEILVEVHAASVNPFDWKVRDGTYKEYFPVPFPATLGGDVAGVVAEVGEDVEGFTVGQEVFGQANAVGGQGSLAEFTVVKATSLSAKPESTDFQTAAALPLAAISAYQALADHMHLVAGQKVLIHGAAGGIGSLAVQIAKDLGAYVAATASAEDIDFVKGLGADEVIDYQNQDFTTIVKDYDAVFDNVGGETNTKSYEVLKSGGVLVSMVMPPNDELVAERQISYTQQGTQPTPERLAAIRELVDGGKLKVNVDKVFSLDEAAAALEYLKTGHPKGKVVVAVKA